MSAPIPPFWLGSQVVYDAGALTDFPATVVGYTDRMVRIRYVLPESWRGVRVGRQVGHDPMVRESAVRPKSLRLVGGAS